MQPEDASEQLTNTRLRVYEYGADAPVAGLDVAQTQQRLRVRYWNALVYWEGQRRFKVEELIAPLVEGGIRRKEAFDTVREQVNALAAGRTDYVRGQRQAIAREGLYLAGYTDIERRFNAARRRADPPKPQAYTPERGSVNVPLSHGLPVAQLYGASRVVQFDPVDPAIYAARAGRRRGQRTLLRVRVASRERNPVWLELPVYLHRPLPDGADVRDVRVKWQPVGRRLRYSVTVVVREPAPPPTLEPRTSVALDLAWRQVDGGLRVGFWRGSDGARGELALDAALFGRWAKVEDLRGVRTQRFNTTKLALAEAFADLSVPEWLADELPRVRTWRGPRRLLALLERWQGRRFGGDEAAFALAEAWRHQELHLCDYENNLRDKLIRRRRELYRVAAAALAGRYDQLVLQPFDLGAASRREAAKDTPPLARRNRVVAAPSVLRKVFENAFVREGRRVVTVARDRHTTTCHVCGSRELFDAKRELYHTCSVCKAHWDQDDNAAANLLAAVVSIGPP